MNPYRKRIEAKERPPSGFAVEQHTLPSPPLEEEETNLLLSILCNSPGVTYTPREIKESRANDKDPHRWEIFGFDSQNHYSTWIMFNGLEDDTISEILGNE